MTNDDLKKLQECKTELFEGLRKVLVHLELGHLQIAGIELEPSSVKITSGQPDFYKDGEDVTAERFSCPEGSRRVLRVNPRTGESYYICVPADRV